ncbi:hypothetical protein [Candidatus Allofournierella merdavium]
MKKKVLLKNALLAFRRFCFRFPKRHWCFNTNASFFGFLCAGGSRRFLE